MNVAERLKLAVAAFSRGDVATAKHETAAALRERPNDPNVLQLAGVISCQSGDLRGGTEHLRKALRLGADTPDMRLNLARALVELGELAEAEALCSSTPNEPPSRDLLRMQADILKGQGRLFEAIGVYERLVDSQPDDFQSWNNLGNARHEAGDVDGAVGALERARSLSPESGVIHTNLARVLATMGRDEESCLLFEKAVLLAPGDASALLELGRALSRLDHPDRALPALANAARLSPRDPRIFVEIGLSFAKLVELPKAEQAYRMALRVDPRFSPAYLNLGLLLEQANRVDELNGLIEQADSNGVQGGEVDYLRALAQRRDGRLQEALHLASASVSDAIDPAVRAHFIGQVADRLNQVDVAFAAFDEMNRMMAQTPAAQGIDRSAYQSDVERLGALTTPEWYSAWCKTDVPPNPPAPAFMVGFPRSGTTLLDTILMGHSGTHVLEEIPILETVSNAVGGFTRLAELTERQISDLRALYFAELNKLSPPPPGKLVIDKNPLSMLRMPLIHRLFPDAKIIMVLRHPCDVVLSCFMQNFKVTEAMASFLDLTNASRTYDRVFAYWERCREIFPLRVHTIRYEDMVADSESEIRPLLDFLGLSWDAAMLDHQRTAADRGYIRTPSYAQVTEPVYARASGRWERYRHYMEHVLPILAPWAERLGYGPLPAADEARPEA